MGTLKQHANCRKAYRHETPVRPQIPQSHQEMPVSISTSRLKMSVMILTPRRNVYNGINTAMKCPKRSESPDEVYTRVRQPHDMMPGGPREEELRGDSICVRTGQERSLLLKYTVPEERSGSAHLGGRHTFSALIFSTTGKKSLPEPNRVFLEMSCQRSAFRDYFVHFFWHPLRCQDKRAPSVHTVEPIAPLCETKALYLKQSTVRHAIV